MPLPGPGLLPGLTLLPGTSGPPYHLESLVLDGLDFNSNDAAWTLEQFDAPPPNKRPEWATGADADGASLVRDPLFENRTITLRLRANQQASMDTALDAILALSKKLEECEQQPDGLGLVWSPAGSTRSITFYVISGSVQDVPVAMQGDDAGWFVRAPVVSVVLTCKPFGYGTPVVGGATTSSGQLLTLTLASVTGDVPAEGRLIVTDTATQSRRYLEWGLEQKAYNAGTSLQVQSSALVTSGFAGTSTTRSGSVNTNIVRGTLYYGFSTAIAGTGALAHVGTFRVKARVYASSTAVQARLSWQDGDGSLHSNTYQTPCASGVWTEMDLGLITINTATLGTQKWQGQIEAYSATNADTLDLDYLLLIPAGEGYGRARPGANALWGTGVTNSLDNFDSITVGAALNARTALAGGAWATSGATTDFVGAAAVGGRLSGNVVKRQTASDTGPRFALLGSAATASDIQVGIDGIDAAAGTTAQFGVVMRYVNATNYAYAYLTNPGSSNVVSLNLTVVIAGVPTTLASATFDLAVPLIVRAACFASGACSARVSRTNGSVLASVSATSTTLAGGGAIASGTSGILDYNPSGSTPARYYDAYIAQAPTAEQIVLYSGRVAEVRYDGAQRQDSTGTYYGPVPTYRGSRLLIPPAGDKNRTSRIAVKAHRNNIETSDAANVTDGLSASVTYTPRYLVVPG